MENSIIITLRYLKSKIPSFWWKTKNFCNGRYKKLHHIKWRPNPAGITTWFHEFYQYTIKYVALENVMFLFTKLSNTLAHVTRWTTPDARKFYIQRTMRLNAASLHTYDKSPWLWCHSESSTAHVAWSVDLVTICHFSCFCSCSSSCK